MRVKCIAIPIVLSLLVAVVPVAARTPSFEHLTVDDGLPENSVRSILQDSRGFLWFGTHDGLARYDGYEMETFLPDPDDPHSIFPRFLIAMAEDDSGMVWIGSYANGLSRYDPGSGRFTNYLPDRTDAGSPPGSRVVEICPAADGLWVALGDGGLCRFDGREFVRVPILPPQEALASVAPPSLTSLLVTADRIWVGTDGFGLAFRDRNGGTWRLLRHDRNNPRSLPTDRVTDLFQDAAGRIWVATREGLALYRGDDGFEVYRPDRAAGATEVNYLVQIDADAAGQLWIGSAVGLYLFDPTSGEFRLFTHDPDKPDSPVLGPVLSVLVDRSGIVWAGSWHTGLNKYDPWSQKFEVLLHDPADPTSLDDDAVVYAYEDCSGVLWVGTGSLSSGGTSGGLNRQDPGVAGFVHIPVPDSPSGTVRRINAICEDRSGRLWLGSNLGVWRLDDDRRQMIRPPELDGASEYLYQGSVMSMLIDATGRLWVAAWGGGLHRFDPLTGNWVSYWHDPRDPRSLSSNELTALCLDDRGRIWVGTDTAGLHLYNHETDDFRRFDTPGSGARIVSSLYPASDGRVWVGSAAGVLLFSADGGVEWSFTTRDGLPSDAVGQLRTDRNGRLWVSTGRGLVRLDLGSGEFAVFDKRDGLPRNERHFAALVRSDGRMYFGGHHGLIVFDPDSVRVNPFVPPLAITQLRVGDEPFPIGGDARQRSWQETAVVRLRHEENDISIAFSALHFAHPERNRYRYRLDRYDTGWRTAGPRRTAHYTNLDPGRYEFQVIGSNADGVWNETPATLQIVIAPPWWQTRWATGIYILAAILVAWGIYRQIVQRERMRAALEIRRVEAHQLQDLDRLKSRFFANISHEFRTPLTLLNASVQRLQEDPDAAGDELYEMMGRNADRLGQLIDQLLDLSRLEAGHMPVRWQRGDWQAYLRALVSSYESLVTSGEITLKSEWPQETEDGWFDADLLDKVAGNLLANALKFTPPGGEITFCAALGRKHPAFPVPGAGAVTADVTDITAQQVPARIITIEVANTGSYIPPKELSLIFDRFHQIAGSDGGDGRGTGIGLALVKELIQWYGGSISVDSDRELGTVFRVELPVYLEAPVPADADPPSVTLQPAARTAAADVMISGAETDDEVEEPAERDLTILVVEDHPDLRAFLRDELAADYTLLEAPDGRVGLDMARREIPDLVLTDVMMPELDGFELCRRLKTDERTSHVPVVMLTAKTESESRLAGLEIGADDYLTKPFNIAELKLRIANLLDQRRRLTERFARRALDPRREAELVVSADEVFLERARQVVAANLADSDFRVEAFCQALGMSRTQLHRKLKAVAGQSAGEFLRTQRLVRAAEMLAGNFGNVTEVVYAVGFRNLSHFAKAFREQFGVAPSEYGK